MSKFATAWSPRPQTPPRDAPNKQAARSTATRRKLLDGASRTFAEKGYHATRISDITKNSGVALGNFYRHFDNKNEIFTEVLRPIFLEMLALSGRMHNELSARSIDDLAMRNIRYIRYFADHQKLFRAGYEAAASAASGEFFHAWFRLRELFLVRSRSWISSLIRSGAVEENIDIEFMAEALGAMNEQFIYIRVVRMESKPSEAEITKMARMLAYIWWRVLFEDEDNGVKNITNESQKTGSIE